VPTYLCPLTCTHLLVLTYLCPLTCAHLLVLTYLCPLTCAHLLVPTKYTDSYLTHLLGLLAYIRWKTNLKEPTPEHSVKIPTGLLYSLMILLPA